MGRPGVKRVDPGVAAGGCCYLRFGELARISDVRSTVLPLPVLLAKGICWWVAGSARANLHKWIHAATVIQRAVRAWQLRKGLQQFASRRQRCIAAVTRLQAMWRARAARQQFLQQRGAVQRIQVCWVSLQSTWGVANDAAYMPGGTH